MGVIGLLVPPFRYKEERKTKNKGASLSDLHFWKIKVLAEERDDGFPWENFRVQQLTTRRSLRFGFRYLCDEWMFGSPYTTLKIWKRLIYVSMFSFTIFYRCSNVCFYVVASIVSRTLPNISQNVYD